MSMNLKSVLVIGGGGREHAICWKLAQSSHVNKVFVFPGSCGIAEVQKVEIVQGLSLKNFQVIPYLNFRF